MCPCECPTPALVGRIDKYVLNKCAVLRMVMLWSGWKRQSLLSFHSHLNLEKISSTGWFVDREMGLRKWGSSAEWWWYWGLGLPADEWVYPAALMGECDQKKEVHLILLLLVGQELLATITLTQTLSSSIALSRDCWDSWAPSPCKHVTLRSSGSMYHPIPTALASLNSLPPL